MRLQDFANILAFDNGSATESLRRGAPFWHFQQLCAKVYNPGKEPIEFQTLADVSSWLTVNCTRLPERTEYTAGDIITGKDNTPLAVMLAPFNTSTNETFLIRFLSGGTGVELTNAVPGADGFLAHDEQLAVWRPKNRTQIDHWFINNNGMNEDDALEHPSSYWIAKYTKDQLRALKQWVIEYVNQRFDEYDEYIKNYISEYVTNALLEYDASIKEFINNAFNDYDNSIKQFINNALNDLRNELYEDINNLYNVVNGLKPSSLLRSPYNIWFEYRTGQNTAIAPVGAWQPVMLSGKPLNYHQIIVGQDNASFTVIRSANCPASIELEVNAQVRGSLTDEALTANPPSVAFNVTSRLTNNMHPANRNTTVVSLIQSPNPANLTVHPGWCWGAESEVGEAWPEGQTGQLTYTLEVLGVEPLRGGNDAGRAWTVGYDIYFSENDTADATSALSIKQAILRAVHDTQKKVG